MKQVRCVIALMGIILLASGPALGQSLTHDVGRVRMGITGRGFLAGEVDLAKGIISPTFLYPADAAKPQAYLQGFSEIMVGTGTPPVASALDVEENRVVLGDWKPTANGEPEDVSSLPGRQEIRTSYEAGGPDSPLPYHIVVEQTSYAWADTATPESNGIVLKLTLTNQGDLPLDGIATALMTNWDVDPQIAQEGKPSLDLVQWDDARRASIVFQGDSSQGVNPVQVATALLQGPLFANRILPTRQTPLALIDANRAQILGTPGIQAEAIVPNNYVTFLVSGPLRLEGKRPVTLIFGLIAGESRAEIERNIDGIREAITRPEQLSASVGDEGIRLAWNPPIRTDIIGYAVFRADAESGPFEQIGPRIVDATEYVDADAVPNVKHFYRIQPVDGNEQLLDVSSNIVSAATSAKPPAIQRVAAQVLGDGERTRVAFTVEPPTGVDPTAVDLLLFRNETGREPFTLIGRGDFFSGLRDVEVAPGKRYYYTIRLINEFTRVSDPSPVVEAAIPVVESAPLPDLARVVAAPNPVRRGRGEVLRFMNLPSPVTVFIYTAAGERVARLDGSARTLEWRPAADLANGVYLYQIEWIPEAQSADVKSAPTRTRAERIAGKFVLME